MNEIHFRGGAPRPRPSAEVPAYKQMLLQISRVTWQYIPVEVAYGSTSSIMVSERLANRLR